MALDRQSIEKRDFPIERRGYDPGAVDAHLAQIAVEVEALKLETHDPETMLASLAGERVSEILAAAEAGASAVIRRAEADAREIRADASQEAQAARSQAVQDASATRGGAAAHAREQLERVSQATAAMLERLSAMEAELTALLDGVRTGANRLNADLQLIEGHMESVRIASEMNPEGVSYESGGAGATPRVPAGPVEQAASGSSAPAGPASGGPASGAVSNPALTAVLEAARLAALNMALNGTARADADRYLAANFPLRDRKALLDEVYASVGS